MREINLKCFFLFLFQSQNKAKQCRDAAYEAGDTLFATELIFFSAKIYQHANFDSINQIKWASPI